MQLQVVIIITLEWFNMFCFAILIAAIVLVEVIISPRLDFTDGKYILWYGNQKRNFIVLWDLNK